MLEFNNILYLVCGLCVGGVVGFAVSAWQYRNDFNKMFALNEELTKFLMVKQDMGAFATAFPKPDMVQLKQEENQKTRKDIIDYNTIMLRDSVTYGLSDDEIKRFGLNKEEITA